MYKVYPTTISVKNYTITWLIFKQLSHSIYSCFAKICQRFWSQNCTPTFSIQTWGTSAINISSIIASASLVEDQVVLGEDWIFCDVTWLWRWMSFRLTSTCAAEASFSIFFDIFFKKNVSNVNYLFKDFKDQKYFWSVLLFKSLNLWRSQK